MGSSIWRNGDSGADHSRGAVADRQARDLATDVQRGEVSRAEAAEITREINSRR